MNIPVTTAPPLPQVRLKIARRSSHPWIFQKMVERPTGRLPGGSVVDIVDRDNQWVGRGFYNGHSRIALRVLTADASEAIDEAFFARRLGQAIAQAAGEEGLINGFRSIGSQDPQGDARMPVVETAADPLVVPIDNI